MELKPHILFGHVMHKRLFPKKNGFSYKIYYIAFPLSKIRDLAHGIRFGLNKFGLLSFYERDHGDRNGESLELWTKAILEEWNVGSANGEIVLVTLPRVLNYVFNPVSFWLCLDTNRQLRAVICEVNNTFGETHSYLCSPQGGGIIDSETTINSRKLFHVSPFLERDGHYRFRFLFEDGKFGSWIDFYDENGEKKLITALTGHLHTMNPETLRKAFWTYPLITLKSIGLIHFQAIRLLVKKVKYISKPRQLAHRSSAADHMKR